MKATEFRVGNLLNYCGNAVTVMEISRNNRVELGYFTDSIVFIRSLDDENIKPIPLTEKILEKCCEANTNGTFIYKPRLIVNRQGEWYDYGTDVKLEYLHQFQNFIFATTKEELKIEL